MIGIGTDFANHSGERSYSLSYYTKGALDNKINIAVNSGSAATDEFMSGIIAAVNKYLMSLAKEQIRLAFEQSQKEVDDLHQRTREGIQTAKINGKQIGQHQGAKLVTKKSLAAKEIILKHSQDFSGSLNDLEVMRLTGLARNTYYKYKRELREAIE